MQSILSKALLLSFCSLASGQKISRTDSTWIISKQFDDRRNDWKVNNRQSPFKLYSETESNGVVIQNSFPKGGGYTDRSAQDTGYRVFWTRIINETTTPLELTINFPADSFAVSPGAYIKLLLPPDTMTLDKEVLYSYGLENVQSFLDSNLHKPTMLKRSVKPGEACIFYVIALLYQAAGVARAELVSQEQALLYRINLLDPVLIPCGKIVIKN